MSIDVPGHFIALHHSGHHISETHPQASQALSSMSSTFPLRNFPPILPSQATPPMMSPSATSPPPYVTPSMPQMTPKASPPMSQEDTAFRPQPHAQASMPIPQAQPLRPAMPTQQSAPVPQVQVHPAATAARPAQKHRHSSGVGRFFSDTASGVLANVIATEITTAANGTGGGDSGSGWAGDSGFS